MHFSGAFLFAVTNIGVVEYLSAVTSYFMVKSKTLLLPLFFIPLAVPECFIL